MSSSRVDKGKIKTNTSSNSSNSLSSSSLSKSSSSMSKSNASLSTSNKSTSQSMDSDKSAEANKSSSKMTGDRKNTRVVQSRYKAAAVAVKKDTSSGMLDSTLSTTIIAPKGPTIIFPKGPTIIFPKGPKSQSNRSGTTKESIGDNVHVKPSSLKRSASVKESISDNALLKPSSLKRSASIKKQLHSTALNATHLNASTLERTVISDPCKFSTTVVSGKGGIISPKPEVFGELPDLSNISIIAKPSKTKRVELKEEPVATAAVVTTDQLEQAHLHALLWQLLDVESDHAAHMQEKEAMNQLLYLDHLVKEKEKEVHESNEKLGLLMEAERAHAAYKTQIEDLRSLSGYMPAIGEATENLSRGLEKTLHQINTKDLYTPQDELQYGDNFEKALDENLKLLEDLENKMHPRQESIFDFQAHVNDTQMVSNMMQECSIKIQQSESLTVQEASLKLGGTQRESIPGS